MRAVLAPLLTLPLLAFAPAPAAHAAGTCQGQPATIESATPGATLTGTEGPDVILATASATINALGGDDLICAAGGVLDAGPGNDSVLATPTASLQEAHLGAGTNRYLSTGTGTDRVFSGTTTTEPNRDVVDTGAGLDQLVADLPAGSQLQARASTSSLAVLRGTPGDTASWLLTIGSGLSRDTVPIATLTGFRTTYLDLPATAAATVVGTGGDDRAYVSAGDVRARLGHGDDLLAVGSSAADDETGIFDVFTGAVPTSGTLNLGKGHDRLYVESPGTVRLDLAKRRLNRQLFLQGVEQTSLWARRAVYRGTSDDDIATAWACRATLRGGAGDDYLAPVKTDLVTRDLGCTTKPSFRLYGGSGDDELFGDDGRDLLIGGRGHDRANGHAGRDSCSAEIEHNC